MTNQTKPNEEVPTLTDESDVDDPPTASEYETESESESESKPEVTPAQNMHTYTELVLQKTKRSSETTEEKPKKKKKKNVDANDTTDSAIHDTSISAAVDVKPSTVVVEKPQKKSTGGKKKKIEILVDPQMSIDPQYNCYNNDDLKNETQTKPAGSGFKFELAKMNCSNEQANGLYLENTKIFPIVGVFKPKGYSDESFACDNYLCYCEDRAVIYSVNVTNNSWQNQNDEWKKSLGVNTNLELRCPNMKGRTNKGCGFKHNKVAYMACINMFTKIVSDEYNLPVMNKYVSGLPIFYCRCTPNRPMEFKLPFSENPPDVYCGSCYSRISFLDACIQLKKLLFSQDPKDSLLQKFLLTKLNFVTDHKWLIKNATEKLFKWESYKISENKFNLAIRGNLDKEVKKFFKK